MHSDHVGFLGLLCLMFIGLKLGGVIAWSWWMVLLPILIPGVIFLALGTILIGVAIVSLVIKGKR